MSFWRQYFHLVWGTLDRLPLIEPEMDAPLFAQLVKKASELGVYVYAVNGWVDHIHMVVAIPPKHGSAEIVRQLKGASSHFVNHSLKPSGNFQWQRGYGSLSIGQLQRPIAEDYVRRQKEHHQFNTTNPYLEYISADDEGPPDRIEEDGTLHEDNTLYQSWDDDDVWF
jgi:putative transposase